MAVTALYEGSASISTTEYSLTLSSTSGVPASKTAAAVIQIWLDLNALAAGDEYSLKLYEKVTSSATQRSLELARLKGAQGNPFFISPAIMVKEAWDVTLDRIAGSDRTIVWAIRSA